MLTVSPGRTVCTASRLFGTQETPQSPEVHRHPTANFDERCLKVLVCPVTKKPLRYDRERNLLVSDEIGKAYPIEDGIPNLIPGNALPLNE